MAMVSRQIRAAICQSCRACYHESHRDPSTSVANYWSTPMRSCSLFARVYVAKSRQRKIEGCHAIAVPCKVGRDVQEVICHESIRGSDLMLDRISSVMLVHGPQ